MEVTHTYANPWFNQTLKSGNPMYTRSSQPTEYNGYQIFKVHASQFDVVKNGVCLTQVGSMRYATEWIDAPDTDVMKAIGLERVKSLMAARGINVA